MPKSVKLVSLGLIFTAALFALSACSENSAGTSADVFNSTPKTSEPEITETAITEESTNPALMATQSTPLEEQLSPPEAGDTIAVLETDLGTIKFKLFPELVPEITKNFISLAESGKYNNVPFHRVIKDFMIQTGDFTDKNGMGGYSYKGKGTELPDEIVPSLRHLYGTVSMANRGPDTNGSQFFIVTNKNGTPHLDGGYSVFGQVYEGMDVALKIADLQASDSDRPVKIVNIKTVQIETVK